MEGTFPGVSTACYLGLLAMTILLTVIIAVLILSRYKQL